MDQPPPLCAFGQFHGRCDEAGIGLAESQAPVSTVHFAGKQADHLSNNFVLSPAEVADIVGPPIAKYVALYACIVLHCSMLTSCYFSPFLIYKW